MPDELMQKLSSKQFGTLLGLYRESPFGSLRDDIHFAQLCALLANIHRGKNQKPFKVTDFLLDKPKEESKSIDKMREFVDQTKRIYG